MGIKAESEVFIKGTVVTVYRHFLKCCAEMRRKFVSENLRGLGIAVIVVKAPRLVNLKHCTRCTGVGNFTVWPPTHALVIK